MREYWFTQSLLSIAGWGYVTVVLVAVIVALWLPKRRSSKLIALIVVVGLASIAPRKANQELTQQKAAVDEYKAHYSKAKAIFDEKCKTAGAKIYRQVDSVEGVLLLNIRQNDKSGGKNDQLWPDAALPNEAYADQYIRHFLYTEYDGSPQNQPMIPGERGYLSVGVSGNPTVISHGYRFVDVKQADGTFLRYRLQNVNKPDLVSEPIKGKPSRFAVGFENQINPEDRTNWVAGTTITLTDTQTHEVIATRESYSFEPGLGSTAGGRQPWAFAVTCPKNSRELPGTYLTRFFVDQILKPEQSESPARFAQ